MAAADLAALLQMGLALAWLLRVPAPERAAWLGARRTAAWAVPLFLAGGPAVSGFMQAPGLDESLNSLGWQWHGALAWCLMIALFVALAALLLWHLLHAWRRLSARGLLAFLGARLAVVAFYAVVVGGALGQQAAQSRDGGGGLQRRYVAHFHHYLLGWFFATFAIFNAPASALLLAGGAAVLAQGAGAYGMDPLFTSAAACVHVGMPCAPPSRYHLLQSPTIIIIIITHSASITPRSSSSAPFSYATF